MLKQYVAAVAAIGFIMTAGALAISAAGMGNMGGMKMGPMPKHLPKPGKAISYAAAKPLIKYSNSTGMLMGHGKHKSVMFMGHHIHIVMAAVEPGSPDQTFEIRKLVDPEITVPAGARIVLTVLNMDFGPGEDSWCVDWKSQTALQNRCARTGAGSNCGNTPDHAAHGQGD